MPYKVFVTRKIPQPGLDLLQEKCEIEVNPFDRVLTKEEIIKGLQGKDALLCLLTDQIDKEIISSNPALKVISNYAVGYNNIDIDCATERNIPVTNTPGVLTESTADLTWALILSLARRIVESDLFTRKGKFKGWGPELLLGMELNGKTLGIIGFGRIGSAVARRAVGFNMNILYHNDKRLSKNEEKNLNVKYASLKELLKNSDFVSLHVPLTEKTKYLIGEEELKLMKRSSYLINTSRGPVVDEKALIKILKEKIIGGAGLDVYENEPELSEGLIDLENTVLLPHTGSATIEARTKMALMAAENLLTVLDGKVPLNLVNKKSYNLNA